jgi:hypothetical protein
MTLAVAGEAPAASAGGDAGFVSNATSGGMREAELGRYTRRHTARTQT